MSHMPGVPLQKLIAQSVTAANSSIVLPANCFIESIFVKNNSANAITGGLKIGSTNGGTDIMAAISVGANSLVEVLPSAILKTMFSVTNPQTIYIDAVVAWNSANVDITVVYGQL